MNALIYHQFSTPLGDMTAVADMSKANCPLVQLAFSDSLRLDCNAAVQQPNHPTLRATEQQIREYFTAPHSSFDLPLAPAGTNFQQTAWRALQTIPLGQTRSYSEQAKTIGKPDAVRAIGAANGRNPIAIVIPCHRVIGSNGKLTGYAGGIARKQKLLQLEKQSIELNDLAQRSPCPVKA